MNLVALRPPPPWVLGEPLGLMCCCSPLYLYSVTKKSCTMCHDKRLGGTRPGHGAGHVCNATEGPGDGTCRIRKLCPNCAVLVVPNLSFAFLEFKNDIITS